MRPCFLPHIPLIGKSMTRLQAGGTHLSQASVSMSNMLENELSELPDPCIPKVGPCQNLFAGHEVVY
jgi:hypothetical protein